MAYIGLEWVAVFIGIRIEAPVAADPAHEAAEREHLGDPESKTGIYAEQQDEAKPARAKAAKK